METVTNTTIIAPEIKTKIEAWLSGNFDQATKDEIRKLQDENPSELADAFYRNLEFGTGGLRGLMGVGTNRMNKYTVGMATQGYANYLKQSFPNREIKILRAMKLLNFTMYPLIFPLVSRQSTVHVQGTM